VSDEAKITSRSNGPLLVSGQVALVRKTAVRSEHGEPLTWLTSAPVTDAANYALCRCGGSTKKPFCDGTHAKVGFDGSETAAGVGEAEGSYEARSKVLGGTGITVSDDRSICVHAGFCGTRVTNVWKDVANSDDSSVRLAVINAVEKCPSGALSYRLDGGPGTVEPDYRVQIGIIDDGPLWVTGGIPVTTADGRELETRARVTLCRCGASGNKPLCDGSHQKAGFTDS
jgi:CDGSH-type Zn-finger protein/ferredoxin